MLTINRGTGTKQFDLSYKDNKYVLDIVAFGDWWSETFDNIESLVRYLRDEWYLTNEEIKTCIESL